MKLSMLIRDKRMGVSIYCNMIKFSSPQHAMNAITYR
ncbi:hypothetical protein TcasGA2_TC032550 [Tribolium castaneum]|uniref:Uncharacterized protein n=1 Tax=Tribolium castaneum TaxID=7070 RepID=A0A139WKJ3_TRICA|nr:hypothetical protein TcasGA2_TC032550 [Tribolium castaneum]